MSKHLSLLIVALFVTQNYVQAKRNDKNTGTARKKQERKKRQYQTSRTDLDAAQVALQTAAQNNKDKLDQPGKNKKKKKIK